MSKGPPLQDGEEVLFDHVPSLRSFKRTALILIGLTIPAVAVMLVVFPDTIWPVVPLFVTCVILMQERVRLGRYRAWITNQRIVMQGDRSIDLADVTGSKHSGNGVRIGVAGHLGKGIKLFYPEDGPALIEAIESAKRNANGAAP
ncbi:MAG: hypothetical protein AAGL89_14530 [Pseudomonadota bacterium]